MAVSTSEWARENAVLLDSELVGLARLRNYDNYDNCVGTAMLELSRASALPIVEAAPFPGEGWDQSDYDRTDCQKNERYGVSE